MTLTPGTLVDRGVTTVEVRPHWLAPHDRYVACVVRDGVQTTFECTHLHHTPAAAAKCRMAVGVAWAGVLEVRRIGETSSGDLPLYEAVLARTPDGRMVTARRFSEVRDGY